MKKNKTFDIIEKVSKSCSFRFADNTTYRSGGFSRIAYFPKSIRQSVAVFDYLKSLEIQFVILGNGSNILAADSFFDGAVFGTKNLAGVYRSGENSIFCRAGTKVSSLLKYCVDNNLGGLEYLAGIPASIGGLTYMNGGASGKFISGNVVKVKFYDGKSRNLTNKDCKFGNKYSIMRDIEGVILGAELSVYSENGLNVKNNIASVLKSRAKQPKGASCGCVFKNPDGKSAGKIIEEAGLKGLKSGGAEVSFDHANFIINSGTSSSDVYRLIKEVKRRVFEVSGIMLEEEVVYIGDFK